MIYIYNQYMLKVINRILFYKKGKRTKNSKSQEIFYIIRREIPWSGFFSNYLYILTHIAYALENGFIPVVDMEHYPTLYSDEKPLYGIHNAWEYYYEQLNGNSLKEAYLSENYILSDSIYMEEYIPVKLRSFDAYELDEKKLPKFKNLMDQYIKYKPWVKDAIEKNIISIIKNHVTLGVHVRGTDKRHYNVGHLIAAKYDEYFQYIDELLAADATIDQILLCTDESEAVNVFDVKYGDLLVVTSAQKSKPGEENGLHKDFKINSGKDYGRYLLGLDVIIDMELLSACDYLVHGHSNVAAVARIQNGGKYKKVCFVASSNPNFH